MKKKYEAPEVEVIRYSLHEAIAAGCANKVFNHTTEGCQDDPTDFGQFLLGMGVTFAEDTCGSEIDSVGQQRFQKGCCCPDGYICYISI